MCRAILKKWAGTHRMAPPSASLSRRLVSSSARRYSAALVLFRANSLRSTNCTTSSEAPLPPNNCKSSANLRK